MELNVCDHSSPSVTRFPGRAQVACSQCAMGQLCLPRGLNEKEVESFEQIVKKSHPIQKGEHICRTGDRFHSIAAVRSGCFKSYVIDHEGNEQVLGFHLPGEIIGMDAIHTSTHLSSVVALDTSVVCGLGFNSVSELARRLPGLQTELFRVMSEQISELESNAGDLSADQRIARFLLSVSRRFARRGYSDKEFNLAMSRKEIASYLRLATETVSRVLARFQEAESIAVKRKNVVIRDLQALEKIAVLD
jgi:CRP/FNR family transcriptional regulator